MHSRVHRHKGIQLGLIFLLVTILALTGCGSQPTGAGTSNTTGAEGNTAGKETEATAGGAEAPLVVVTTLFPQYDFAKTIGGTHAEVSMLIPPGVEPHAFEPTPGDILKLSKADMVLYTGEAMEPWVHKIMDSVEGKALFVDLSTGIELMKGHHHHHDHDEADCCEGEAADHDHEHEHEHDHDHDGEAADHDHDHEHEHDHDGEAADHDHEHEHDHDGEAADHDHEHDHDHDGEDADHDHEHEHEHDHDHGEYDPHYWLDPQNAVIMVEEIRDAFIDKDAAHADAYTKNAEALISELKALDADIENAVAKFESKTILMGGHYAFGYFSKRYGLENMSPYAGFAPNAEPTPQRIAELLETVKQTKAKAIFYEELLEPRVADTISKEAHVEMLLLHGLHNVSKSELEQGVTYLDIMRGNLDRLKKGLGYHE